jgi:ATPase subunit of ABC transporter with duplicated ATPase domains
MLASISLANVSWSTPDGKPVLSDISLTFQRERTGIVGANGVGKSTLLRLIARDLVPTRGRITVEGRLGTLRQMAQVPAYETIAELMGISAALALLRKAEAGAASSDDIAEADWTLETRATEALARIGLDADLDAPLSTLSGGQRTRAGLAGLVFAQPDFILLDEPTNNLDRDGRRALGDMLSGWRRGALIVSHDRELLDAMDATVELTTIGAARFGGNWTAFRVRKGIEQQALERDLASAERHVADVARREQRRVEQQQRRDAGGHRRAMRGDLPKILLGMRRDRAEKTGGEGSRLFDRLREEAEQSAADARRLVERTEPIRVELAPSGLASGQRVLDIDTLDFGYRPSKPLFRGLQLHLMGPERVAICGPNGSGKSTLLELIAGRLAPWRGRAGVHVPFSYFDQSVSLLDPHITIADNFGRLNPSVGKRDCRASLARFHFKADTADRQVATLSGGQLLRAGLACVLGGPRPPSLLILDEPTNHLDMDSIAAVETGLRAFDGALLIVSHDEVFLDAVRITRRINIDRV